MKQRPGRGGYAMRAVPAPQGRRYCSGTWAVAGRVGTPSAGRTNNGHPMQQLTLRRFQQLGFTSPAAGQLHAPRPNPAPPLMPAPRSASLGSPPAIVLLSAALALCLLLTFNSSSLVSNRRRAAAQHLAQGRRMAGEMQVAAQAGSE